MALEADTYEKIVDSLHIGISVCQQTDLDDPESFVATFSNQASTDATRMKLKLEDTIGKRIVDITPGMRTTGFLQQYAELLKKGESRDFGEVYYPGDENLSAATFSTYFHILSRDTFYYEFSNVTEQKKTQDTLKTTLEELTRINALMINRELKMAELKAEISKLKQEKETGEPSSETH